MFERNLAVAFSCAPGGCFSGIVLRAWRAEKVTRYGKGPSDQRSAISDQRSAISYQRSAISDQRSAISDQRSAISDQRSAISDQRSAISTKKPATRELFGG
jgi:hypothetical protein